MTTKVCAGLIKMVMDYRAYAENVINRPCVSNMVGSNVWSPPVEGMVKINTDAYMAGDGSVGLGAVARDMAGTIVWLGSERVEACWEVEVAEAQAALFGLRIAKDKGMTAIVLECDALNLVRAVRTKYIARTPVGLCIEDICTLLNSFVSSNCVHVKRGGNTVAHYVARICTAVGESIILVSDFPHSVISLAEFDVI